MKSKLYGTKEWAEENLNFISGCKHDCKYCYAKAMAIRFKRKTSNTWKEEEVRDISLNKRVSKLNGTVMFPSSHDITPQHLDSSLLFLKKLLVACNRVLVVSKPHMECIRAICDEFSEYKDQILFRFTIGSSDSAVLEFWEPGAPDFNERLDSLKYAFNEGFRTSISSEPMLDDKIDDVIDKTLSYVTDAIWLGKVNSLKARLKFNGHADQETLRRAEDLESMQADENIISLYERYKDNEMIKWKEGIKKVVGIPISTEAGLDI